jgi:hypothetical protein
MRNSYKYKVAGHVFEVVLPCGLSAEEYLPSYLPFEYKGDDSPLFSLALEYVDALESVCQGEVKECLNDEAPYFWIFGNDGRYEFGFSYNRSHPDCVLVPSEDFSSNVLYVPVSKAERHTAFALSNAMMLIYTFRTNPFDTLMVHASVIRYEDNGYIFLGRSGTGKSTHSRLWLENIEGAVLLNDDNPVIRLTEGVPYVFGTPWSGKTPCYKNEAVPLKAVVRIEQAPANVITRNNPLLAYASLMPSCSCMRWDRRSVDFLHKTVEKVISTVSCWHLKCLPDADAAYTCHKAVTK